MYRPQHLGFLGQTPVPTAASNLVPGTQYTIQLAVSPSGLLGLLPTLPPAPDQGDISGALTSSYAPVAGGALAVIGIDVEGSIVTLTILTGSGSDVLQLGNVASSIADTLNNSISGYTFTVQGLGGGLGTTTFGAQEAQQGGVIVSPVPGLVAGAQIVGSGAQAVSSAVIQAGKKVLALTPIGIASAFATGTLPGTSPPPPPPSPTVPTWVWWILGGVGVLLVLDLVS